MQAKLGYGRSSVILNHENSSKAYEIGHSQTFAVPGIYQVGLDSPNN